MQDFLEVLLYIIVGFWILRLVIQWVFPHLLKYFLRKMTHKAQKGFESQHSEGFQNKKQSNQQFKSQSKDDKEKVGEYIDFEEID